MSFTPPHLYRRFGVALCLGPCVVAVRTIIPSSSSFTQTRFEQQTILFMHVSPARDANRHCRCCCKNGSDVDRDKSETDRMILMRGFGKMTVSAVIITALKGDPLPVSPLSQADLLRRRIILLLQQQQQHMNIRQQSILF